MEELGLPVFTGPGDGTAGGVTAKPAVVPEKSSEGVDSPFILSEALPVVSAKLVRRILRGEYIDMAELLKDNMEAERRRLSAEGGSHFNRQEVSVGSSASTYTWQWWCRYTRKRPWHIRP